MRWVVVMSIWVDLLGGDTNKCAADGRGTCRGDRVNSSASSVATTPGDDQAAGMAHFADERVPGGQPRAVGRVDRDPRVVGVLRPARRSARAGSGSRDYELEQVGDVQGKTLLHLQCHFGIDTLSWARLGATVTGADFSPKAIELATRLAADLGLDARFVESNVYDLPERLGGYVRRRVHVAGRAVLAPRHPRLGARRRALREARGHLLHHRGAPDRVGLDEELPLTFRYPYWEHAEPDRLRCRGLVRRRERRREVREGVQLAATAWARSSRRSIDAGLTIELLREYPFSSGTWASPSRARTTRG